jgi:hypothetical protein
VKEEDSNGWVLQGLHSFTKYKVIVQAFNNVGAGPASAGVIAFTGEAGQYICFFENVCVLHFNLTVEGQTLQIFQVAIF